MPAIVHENPIVHSSCGESAPHFVCVSVTDVPVAGRVHDRPDHP